MSLSAVEAVLADVLPEVGPVLDPPADLVYPRVPVIVDIPDETPGNPGTPGS